MRSKYEIPSADFIYFQTEDIMTTSGDPQGNPDAEEGGGAE